MNRSHLWKLILIVVIVGSCIVATMPPTNQDLIREFEHQAKRPDATLKEIANKARQLETAVPNRSFAHLKEAVGTNDLTKYFPQYNVAEKKDPNTFILYQVQKAASGKIHLGLDLQGGSQFLVQMDTNQLARASDKESALENAVEVLRRRVDKLGVAEPILQPEGDNRILIQLPGLSDAVKDDARKSIETAAYLEFRMVHPNSAELLNQGVIEPGYEVLYQEARKTARNPDARRQPLLVNKKPERGLTGKFVTKAYLDRQPLTGEPAIAFELNSEGAKLFEELTKEYSPKGNKKYQLAIVLDGVLYSAPEINGVIPGGRGQITGQFDVKEAQGLANVLNNPLEAPVKVVDERSVDPSLGKDAIRSGITAAVVGTLAVAIFMAVYYLLSGIVANIALILNLIILLGVMCSIDTTLTLPGIAGIVLTAGMAVDANVLIFERIREEVAKGKSLRGALAAGYSRAFGTIFDSHVTTLISSVILIFMGTGSIKGFGVALTIGVAASLFTALVVTRLIFDFLLAKNWLKSLPMLHMIRATKLDFMTLAKPAFILSWVLIVIGISYGVYRGPKSLFSADFLGGETSIFEFQQRPDDKVVRETLVQAGVADPTIQFQTEIDPFSKKHVTLHVVSPEHTGDKVRSALEELPGLGLHRVGHDLVGATIGQEIQRTAVIASLLSLFGILIYVAVRY